MKPKTFWTTLLIFWTLLLALWTGLCWNAWTAGAAERSSLDGGTRTSLLADDREARPQTLLDVPFIDQRPGFPTGCESVSAVMVLRYWGLDISVEEWVDGYLPLANAPYVDENGLYVGGDPREAFLGDPRSEEGWGCYAPVISLALERLFADRGSGFSVKDLSGENLETLCGDWVARGIPVLVWATIGMETPQATATFAIEDTGESFSWIYPMHCLVLVGQNEKEYAFNDPLSGKSVFYPKEAVEQAYEGLGRQALAIQPAS